MISETLDQWEFIYTTIRKEIRTITYLALPTKVEHKQPLSTLVYYQKCGHLHTKRHGQECSFKYYL